MGAFPPPSNSRGILTLTSTCYALKGQNDSAIQDLDQAIRLNPNDADAFYNRGNAYARKSQFDRAIQDFDQAIRLRSQQVLSLQLSNINSIEVLANVVFGISAAERHISTPWRRRS
jgi:tetratricopeptide (TPR) repeat protein